MSGRDLFTYNPDLVGGDDEEAGGDIEREVEEQEVLVFFVVHFSHNNKYLLGRSQGL